MDQRCYYRWIDDLDVVYREEGDGADMASKEDVWSFGVGHCHVGWKPTESKTVREIIDGGQSPCRGRETQVRSRGGWGGPWPTSEFIRLPSQKCVAGERLR